MGPPLLTPRSWAFFCWVVSPVLVINLEDEPWLAETCPEVSFEVCFFETLNEREL